jgi:hypothetical protein
MAMLVMLFTERAAQVSLGPQVLRRLGALGITNLTLLQRDDTAAVVLEGWAFDPARSEAGVADALGAAQGVTLLHPLTQMTVAAHADHSQPKPKPGSLRC